MTARLPICRCSQCGELLNRAVGIAHMERLPKAGDATICIDCAHVMIFTEELTLRDPTTEEWRSLNADPFVRMIRALHLQYLSEQTKH